MSEQLEQIVDLIRAEHRRHVGGFAISTAEAMDLIEQYAKAQSGAVVVAALKEAHQRTMATLDAFSAASSLPDHRDDGAHSEPRS